MRFILHKFVLVPAIMAAAALATTSAKAETTVKVPFSFTVGGKVLPAGQYAVRHDATENFVTFASKRSPQSFTWVLGPGMPDPTDNAVVLKFDQSGQTHALQSIQVGSMITGHLDKKTATEMEMGQPSTGR
ncbi:MAG: hypothetical protein WBV28_02565 [Terracidiphilus sp.]